MPWLGDDEVNLSQSVSLVGDPAAKFGGRSLSLLDFSITWGGGGPGPRGGRDHHIGPAEDCGSLGPARCWAVGGRGWGVSGGGGGEAWRDDMISGGPDLGNLNLLLFSDSVAFQMAVWEEVGVAK